MAAQSEIFWRATGQSNLAGRMEDCSSGQSAVVCEHENQTLEAFAAASQFVCQFELSSRARQNNSPLATAHDCETLNN